MVRVLYLDFTIVIHNELPGHSQESQIKSLVAQYFGPILEWIPQHRNTVQGQKPHLRESYLKFLCSTDGSQYRPNHLTRNLPLHYVYRSRIREWIKQIAFFTPAHQRPWLEIHSNEAFRMVRAACHEDVPIFQCVIGSLTWSTEFVEVVDLGPELVGSFYHDTRIAEFTSRGTWQVHFKYSNVRHIIVHDGENSVDIIFHLAYPPFIYNLKGSTRGRLRVDTLPDVSANTIGRSNALKVRMPRSDTAEDILSRLFFRCGKMPVAFTCVNFKPRLSEDIVPRHVLENFRCTYMLTALLWRTRSVQLQHQNLERWKTLVGDLARNQPHLLYLVLCDLVNLCDEGILLDYYSALKQLIDYYSRKEDELQLRDSAYITPDNTRHVWRATITPTRCLLWPSSLLFENRILRKFDAEYACRVIFRDDDECRLNLRAGCADPDFYRMAIIAPLVEGITVGQRTFQFLGWSNSQIREHGVWTYATDPKGNTATSIRNWMGDFSHITSVPKFMARMGQCFSQTKEAVTVPLSQDSIRVEDDIMGGHNPENGKPYCFTDGVGKISSSLLEKVCLALNYEGEVIPSAIQFRYGGCKGMLVLDPTLKDVDIVFRQSQKKFSCSLSQELEICKVSAPVAVNLNRQLICILDHLGINTGVFLKLQEDMLRSVTDILIEPDKAVEYLCSRCALNGLPYKDLANSGVEMTSEPFFRALLLAIHRKVVQGIKSKARLEILPETGRNMYGVVDETGKLEYGQVFVQYSTDVSKQRTTKDTIILQGKVLVTKNPCLQSGDVRVLEAVDVPELHHIVDCIVFPQKGPRPHPSEMAGSDLDGDEYTVIWYKDLLFARNAPASHFPIPEEQKKKAAINEMDMLKFLSLYIRNDQVGVLGHTHLARSDRYSLDSEICRSIARKFSISVDFVKNGQLVTLDKEERVSSYPDFMQKDGRKQSYRSKKALGKLYRVCKDFQEEGNIQGLSYSNVKVNADMLYPGYQQYKGQAKATLVRYNRLLDLLLSSNSLNHEAEAIAQANVQLQEQRDRADVEELVLQSLRTIWKKMEKEFMIEFEHMVSLEDIAEKTLQKASAWYYVTYADPVPTHLSFAWIMSSKLVLIKMKNCPKPLSTPRKRCIPNTFKTRLQEMIQLSLKEGQVSALPEEVEVMWNKLPLNDVKPPEEVVKVSLRIIIQWAYYHDLLLQKSDFIVSQRSETKQKRYEITELSFIYLKLIKTVHSSSSVADIIMSFLQKCISLRFQISRHNKSFDENNLRKMKFLGQKAMYTYHTLAISGNLSVLGLSLCESSLASEEQELDPVCLPPQLVSKHKQDNFRIIKNHLIEVSSVTEVNIRKHGESQSLRVHEAQSEDLQRARNCLQLGFLKVAVINYTGVCLQFPEGMEVGFEFLVLEDLQTVLLGCSVIDLKKPRVLSVGLNVNFVLV